MTEMESDDSSLLRGQLKRLVRRHYRNQGEGRNSLELLAELQELLRGAEQKRDRKLLRRAHSLCAQVCLQEQPAASLEHSRRAIELKSTSSRDYLYAAGLSLERKRPEDALRFLGLGRERGALSEKDFRSFREAVLKWKEEHGDSSPGSDLRDGPGGPA